MSDQQYSLDDKSNQQSESEPSANPMIPEKRIIEGRPRKYPYITCSVCLKPGAVRYISKSGEVKYYHRGEPPIGTYINPKTGQRLLQYRHCNGGRIGDSLQTIIDGGTQESEPQPQPQQPLTNKQPIATTQPDSLLYSKLKPEQIQLAKKYKIKPALVSTDIPKVICKRCKVLGALYSRNRRGRLTSRIVHYNLPPIGISIIDKKRGKFNYKEHEYDATKEEQQLIRQRTEQSRMKVKEERELQRQNSITEYTDSKESHQNQNVEYKLQNERLKKEIDRLKADAKRQNLRSIRRSVEVALLRLKNAEESNGKPFVRVAYTRTFK